MKTAGIICEYNPFHLGHLRQLRLTRAQLGEDCQIVCVMSGNYVQRGMPAMWDKYTRAKAALVNGADLVLELPLTGVLQSAEGFARTGVEILTRLGCVDDLSFGAECGSSEQLMTLAKKMDSDDFLTALRDGLDQGLPYAAARQRAMGDGKDLLSQPNNILGLEYCRAILSLQSDLKPLAVTRDGDYHAEQADENAPSATAVRRLYPDGNWEAFVPTAEVWKNVPWYDLSFGERAVLARLRALSDEEWERCAHGSEGLWSKAMKAARSQPNYEAILQATKSKRYPRTRIQRLLLCAYLGITAEMLRRPIPYVRILAATEAGRGIIRTAKKHDGIPLLNPGQTPADRAYFELERRASDLFTLFAAPEFPFSCGTEQNGRIVFK